MIGIIADESEKDAISEFFQLFKTPWEYYQEIQTYHVVIMAKDERRDVSNGKVIFIFSNERTCFDGDYGIGVNLKSSCGTLRTGDYIIPIYAGLACFENIPDKLAFLKQGHSIFGIKIQRDRQMIHRIGFNLFKEIRLLLTKGQPQEYALIPTLEIHIALLKTWILEAGVPVVEISPVPYGHDFIACLTHDADFINIRDHVFDHTMGGFLYRALFVGFINFVRGRIPFSRVLRNWKAVLSLPFVFLGKADDFWFQFDRYMEIEEGATSTFFLIPFKKRPGDKVSSSKRATKYDVMDMRKTVEKLIKKGHEIGVHGIDAWHSQEKGYQERRRINDATGNYKIGIRMHWLLFDHKTFSALEKAGYHYDSTLGYNDAVGYKSGTVQVFRPLGAIHLLELPLHIQDTALFFPGRMNLSEKQAIDLCNLFIQNALCYGGILTINWHQRSLAPERLWGDFYLQLLQMLRVHRPWFATAVQAVEWFEKRRRVTFDKVEFQDDKLHMTLRSEGMNALPGLSIRIHHPKNQKAPDMDQGTNRRGEYDEIPLTGLRDLEISI